MEAGMNANQPRINLGRRDFLKNLGAVGAVAVGGYILSEYTPWLNYDEQTNQIRRTLNRDSAMQTQMRELVRYATLAANGHNTQPWIFTVQDRAIEIRPDFNRELKFVDPDHRELWISLGCALENFLIAARASGFAPEVTYPDSANLIHVALTADIPQNGTLFDAIPMRQNTRSEYDGQLIKTADFNQIQALSLESGVSLQFITSPGGLETVLEYINEGNLTQYAEKAFIDELIHWLRFNKKEALSTMDGLYTRCSGNPEVPRWLGQMFVAGTKPQQQADVDAKKLRSSPLAVVVASASDDKTNWVRTGQVYERLALKTTSLNIKSALLNQPIEGGKIRLQFQSALGLGEFVPQLLIRMGYAEAMPSSLRRPVEEVIQ
jgi:hypothetical protein